MFHEIGLKNSANGKFDFIKHLNFPKLFKKMLKKKSEENIGEIDKIKKQPPEVFYKNTSGRLLLKIYHKKRKMNEDDIEELIGVVKERKDRTKSKV